MTIMLQFLKYLRVTIVSIAILFSCDTPDTHEETFSFAEECSEPKACTYILISISMEIKNDKGQPVALDSYRTKNLSTGNVYDFMEDAQTEKDRQSLGSYPLVSDAQIQDISINGTPVEFTGVKDGKTIVKTVLTIAHDCCHIFIKSGENEVTVGSK